jgi:ABC-type cobalamin/Fe3+-siderophores transport system ATPase subunit
MLSRVEHYISRGRQLYEVIQLIQKKRRFITIVGQPGLGKSTLVRELARYLQFRNYFRDGIVYLELSRC